MLEFSFIRQNGSVCQTIPIANVMFLACSCTSTWKNNDSTVKMTNKGNLLLLQWVSYNTQWCPFWAAQRCRFRITQFFLMPDWCVIGNTFNSPPSENATNRRTVSTAVRFEFSVANGFHFVHTQTHTYTVYTVPVAVHTHTHFKFRLRVQIIVHDV